MINDTEMIMCTMAHHSLNHGSVAETTINDTEMINVTMAHHWSYHGSPTETMIDDTEMIMCPWLNTV